MLLHQMTDSGCEQHATIPAKHRSFRIGLYIIIVFLYWLAQYVYIPTLPVYVRSKTDNLAMIGVVLSMFGLWQAIIRLPLGIAADWVGRRKPFMIGCIVLLGIGAWLMGAAQDVWQPLIGRALTGLAAGAWVLLIVAFTDLFPPEETVRASALLMAVNSTGRLVGTSSTGFLNAAGDYSLAFAVATACAGLSLLAMLLVNEPRRPLKRPTMQSLFRLLTRSDVLLPSVLSALLLYVVWGTTFGFLPLLAKQLGATDVMQSLLVSINVGLGIVGGIIASRLTRRIGIYRLLAINFVCLALGAGLAAFVSSLSGVFVAQFLIGFGNGIGYPVLMGMSIRYVAEAERATAMGLHQAVYAIGMFAGPWFSGIVADRIGMPMMFAGTGLACLILGLFGTTRLSKMRSSSL